MVTVAVIGMHMGTGRGIGMEIQVRDIMVDTEAMVGTVAWPKRSVVGVTHTRDAICEHPSCRTSQQFSLPDGLQSRNTILDVLTP